jgi:sulfate permease, SulP family
MSQLTSAGPQATAQPIRVLPILTAALISGLVVITYQISFGSLIFSGDLAPYTANGIGFCLMGVVLIGAIEAVLSGSPGLVANPTAGSAAIVAAIAAGIAAGVSSSPEAVFPTVTAAITGSTLLTGSVFLILGRFQLGNFIRYFPYPVIGGFLAGTGWLVLSGALKTMSGVSLSWANLASFADPSVLLRWLPGVIFGVTLLLLVRHYRHYLVTPLAILAGILVFYGLLALAGTSLTQAADLGLLFQPFPQGSLWRPPPVSDLAIVEWGVIFSQAGEVVSLILISSITLLLYASGVEVSTNREIDLNRELSACGAGNLAAAFSASPPGYIIVTMSVLSNRLGANHRLVGLLVAGLCAGVIFFGASLISLFPKPVLGGVLVYLGLTFLVEWLVEGRRKLSRPDYLIVVVILLAMSLLGLLAGLGVGLGLAAVLFIIQYSQVPVVRHVYSGRTHHSRVARSQPHADLLREEGENLIILELQGYIFFGTANRIYTQIKQDLEKLPQPPRAVLLDFRRVTGLDASAASSFVRLKRLLKKQRTVLGFVHLQPAIEQVLHRDVLTPADQDAWRVFPDIDRGVEWYEETVLAGESGQQADIRAQAGAVQPGQERGGLALLFAALWQDAEQDGQAESQGLLVLMDLLERVELQEGELLINQGETQEFLYFLDAGELTLEHQARALTPLRLETSGPGSIAGETSFYLKVPAVASVRALVPSVVYRLSAGSLQRLEKESPHTAALLHRYLLKRTGMRLLTLLETVEILAD